MNKETLKMEVEMTKVTNEMEALKAGLKNCPTVGIRRWWIVDKIFPYIHHKDVFKRSALCQYFGITLRRYMFYRWTRLCNMTRVKGLRYNQK